MSIANQRHMQFIAVTRYIQGNLTLRKTYVDRLTALVIDFLVSHTLIVVKENRALVLHSHVRCIFRRDEGFILAPLIGAVDEQISFAYALTRPRTLSARSA